MWLFSATGNRSEQKHQSTATKYQRAKTTWRNCQTYIIYVENKPKWCIAIFMCTVSLIMSVSLSRGCLQPGWIISTVSAMPTSQLSLVTFDLPCPFKPGARSGETELSSPIRIWMRRTEKNFPPNPGGYVEVVLGCRVLHWIVWQLCPEFGVCVCRVKK